MNVFSALEIAASGLHAQRQRMNVMASNLANARTTRTADGTPYRRLDPVFRAVPGDQRLAGLTQDPMMRSLYLVDMPEIRPDLTPPQRVYDPKHPDADAQGYIFLPNINIVEEMVNMITASRAYEASVTFTQTLKGMAQAAISIGA